MTYFAAPGIKGLKVYKRLDYEKVIQLSGEFFNLAPQQIVAKCRRMDIVDARRFIMHYLRYDHNVTLLNIGTVLGGRDHTTVIYGLQSLSDLCFSNDKVKAKLKAYIEYMNTKL